MHTDNFDENSTDKVINYLKPTLTAFVAAGALANPLIGLIGPFLATYVLSTIPNQRIDRAMNFLKFILEHVPENVIKELSTLPDRMAFLEEGLLLSASTPHKNRARRIAAAVVNGLNESDLNLDRKSHLLNIVHLLSDADVIILKLYDPYIEAEDKSEILNKNLQLIPNSHDDRSSENYSNKVSIYRSHLSKLHSYGLLDRRPIEIPNLEENTYRISDNRHITDYMVKFANIILEENYSASVLGVEIIRIIDQCSLGDGSELPH